MTSLAYLLPALALERHALPEDPLGEDPTRAFLRTWLDGRARKRSARE